MDNICGPPVRGDQLQYRDADIEEIISRLTAGNSILLIGLRRIGKSSVMQGVADQLASQWLAYYHDMQDKTLPADLFSVLLRGLANNKIEQLSALWVQSKTIPKRIIAVVKTHLKSLQGYGVKGEFNDSVTEYWEPLTAGVEKIIAESEKPILLVLDEFPFYLEFVMQQGYPALTIQKILGQLKRWRFRYAHFHLLIGGSISMDRILAENKISAATINDLSRYFLPPLTREQAHDFLARLAAAYNLSWYSDALIEDTLDLLADYFPFFLQAFFQELRTKRPGPGGGGLDLGLVFENHFLPAIQKSFFDQFIARLNSHYSAVERRAARLLLTYIARKKDPPFRAGYSELRAEFERVGFKEVELDMLLYQLVGDEFLSADSRLAEYTFATRLVAYWWRNTWGR